MLANGIFGIMSEAGDMPVSGTATYAGPGSAILVDSGSGDVTEQTASAQVRAEFAAGTASVGLVFDDTAVDGVGNPVLPAIDNLSVRDMLIRDSQFVAGTIEADCDDALAADPEGAVSNERAQGFFFGFDPSTRIPDEVGGSLLIEGSDGTAAAGFIAHRPESGARLPPSATTA